MSVGQLESEVLNRVGPDRADGVRELLDGAAFEAPAVASFDMSGLSVDSVTASVGNQISGRYRRPGHTVD